MDVVIVGAGIAGLSAYLSLKRCLRPGNLESGVTVTVIEAYDIQKLTASIKPVSQTDNDEPDFIPVAIGSALGISRNGLAVLQRLDNSGAILRKVKQRGNAVKEWRLSNARGWTLGLAGATPGSNGNNDNKAKSHREVSDDINVVLMIARHDLWEVLRDEAVKGDITILTKKVKDITIGDDTSKNVIEFEDGSSMEADLVIGADGLRSSLRRAMFADSRPKASGHQSNDTMLFRLSSWFAGKQPSDVDYITPHYEGLSSLGGFIPTKELLKDSTFDPKVMNIVFGHNGFVGYGCMSATTSHTNGDGDSDNDTQPGPVSGWWSTFSSPVPYPFRLPSSTSTTTTTTTTDNNNDNDNNDFDSSAAHTNLQTRHNNWSNPTVHRILAYTSDTPLRSTNSYPSWTTPVLPTWHTGSRAVLIGDAAHALQSTSGQGASQALEDAEALSLLLSHYYKHTGNPQAGVTEALDRFERLRVPRVHMIHARAQRMGSRKADMGLVMEMLMYFFIWIGQYFVDREMDAIVNYDLPAEVETIIAAE